MIRGMVPWPPRIRLCAVAYLGALSDAPFARTAKMHRCNAQTVFFQVAYMFYYVKNQNTKYIANSTKNIKATQQKETKHNLLQNIMCISIIQCTDTTCLYKKF